MPDWTQVVRARLRSVRLSPAREAEIVEELAQHLEDRWRELVMGGTPPQIAAEQTLDEFTGSDLLARRLDALRQARWTDTTPPAANRPFSLEGLLADVRLAVRAWRATPGLTIAALAVLALGIGATTAIFSVVDAVVLRALPFDDPDRIVAVGERSVPDKSGKSVPGLPPGVDANDPEALVLVRPQNYLDWTEQQQVFESLAAIATTEFSLHVPNSGPEDLVAQRVTAGFFDVLRIRPARGRLFGAEHEADGNHRVAVLSDAFWRQRLGASPDIVGRTISLDGTSYEVLGVLPPGVTYPVGAPRPTSLWVPYFVAPNERRGGGGRTIGMYLECIARLKPGVSIDHARTHMDQIAAAIAQAYPSPRGPSSVGVRPLQDHVVGASMRSWMIMLFSAVGIVLVIACANVANLLLARATTREREVAVRAALGASRWRLLRQFIVESLVLSAASTVVGVLAAWWVVEVLRSSMPEGVPRVTTIALDLRVLAAATGLAVVTGLLFGLVPALQSSKPNLRQALTESTRGASRSRARRRLGNALVVAEVALAVVLLVGAALFLGSFIRLMRIDPGFAPDGILTMQLYSQTRPGQRPPDWSTAFAQIVERLDQDQKAGIVHASAVAPGIPLSVRMRINGLAIRGDAPGSLIPVSMKSVTPAYYKALRIPLRSGRFFDETDREGGLKVTILNESAATAAFPGQDAVGRTVVLDGADHTVVGVVGDVRQRNLEREALAEAYVPMTQSQSGTGFLVIRTSGDPYAVLPAVRTAVWSVMPDVPLRYVTTMEDLIGRQTAQRRLTMLMLGLFGLLGLVIAAVGVYGVMAYVVSQRTREIGVRMALGATRSDVTSMVIANAGTLVGLGLVLGGTGAWYFGGAAQRFLFGLEAHDLRAFVAAIVVLTLAAMAASVLPARRAASVDPTIALRAE